MLYEQVRWRERAGRITFTFREILRMTSRAIPQAKDCAQSLQVGPDLVIDDIPLGQDMQVLAQKLAELDGLLQDVDARASACSTRFNKLVNQSNTSLESLYLELRDD